MFPSLTFESVFVTLSSARSLVQTVLQSDTPCTLYSLHARPSLPSASPPPRRASALSSDKWSILLFEILFATVECTVLSAVPRILRIGDVFPQGDKCLQHPKKRSLVL